MRISSWLLAAALALPAADALADKADSARSPSGFGSKGYDWYRMTPERVAIGALAGDAARGREAFRGCRGCHKADGEGLVDGTYPRLTGQHASVIVKQVTDVRAGIRVNPKMEPFASAHAMIGACRLRRCAAIALTPTSSSNPTDAFIAAKSCTGSVINSNRRASGHGSGL